MERSSTCVKRIAFPGEGSLIWPPGKSMTFYLSGPPNIWSLTSATVVCNWIRPTWRMGKNRASRRFGIDSMLCNCFIIVMQVSQELVWAHGIVWKQKTDDDKTTRPKQSRQSQVEYFYLLNLNRGDRFCTNTFDTTNRSITSYVLRKLGFSNFSTWATIQIIYER